MTPPRGVVLTTDDLRRAAPTLYQQMLDGWAAGGAGYVEHRPADMASRRALSLLEFCEAHYGPLPEWQARIARHVMDGGTVVWHGQRRHGRATVHRMLGEHDAYLTGYAHGNRDTDAAPGL